MVYLSLVIAPAASGGQFVLTLADGSTTLRSITGYCSNAGSDYSTVWTWLGTALPEITGYAGLRTDVAFHIGNYTTLFFGGRVRLNWVL